MNITDNGNAFVTNSTGGAIYAEGDGNLVSENGAGTLCFAFQGTGHYGTDWKLRDIGAVFNTTIRKAKCPLHLRQREI